MRRKKASSAREPRKRHKESERKWNPCFGCGLSYVAHLGEIFRVLVPGRSFRAGLFEYASGDRKYFDFKVVRTEAPEGPEAPKSSPEDPAGPEAPEDPEAPEAQDTAAPEAPEAQDPEAQDLESLTRDAFELGLSEFKGLALEYSQGSPSHVKKRVLVRLRFSKPLSRNEGRFRSTTAAFLRVSCPSVGLYPQQPEPQVALDDHAVLKQAHALEPFSEI